MLAECNNCRSASSFGASGLQKNKSLKSLCLAACRLGNQGEAQCVVHGASWKGSCIHVASWKGSGFVLSRTIELLNIVDDFILFHLIAPIQSEVFLTHFGALTGPTAALHVLSLKTHAARRSWTALRWSIGKPFFVPWL